jgi:hypothetical protein
MGAGIGVIRVIGAGPIPYALSLTPCALYLEPNKFNELNQPNCTILRAIS